MPKKGQVTILILSIFTLLLLPMAASAHCPLCTIGAGAAAGVAAYLGVSYMSIGVMIGAFAVAMGLWFSRVVKTKLSTNGAAIAAVVLIVLASYILTVWPLRMMFTGFNGALYLPWIGAYGRTLVVDLYLAGAVIGGIILLAGPYISRGLSLLRKNKTWPYQGIILTFLLLLLTAVIIELSV